MRTSEPFVSLHRLMLTHNLVYTLKTYYSLIAVETIWIDNVSDLLKLLT